MTKVQSFKMPFRTRHYRQGQRVWIVSLTGAQAALCFGKWHGRGRYVKAWVNWNSKRRANPDVQVFEVDDAFSRRIMAP